MTGKSVGDRLYAGTETTGNKTLTPLFQRVSIKLKQDNLFHLVKTDAYIYID